MTWEQTAMALMKEVDRLQKENDRLNALVFPAPLVSHKMTAEETAEAAEIIRQAWNGIDTKSAWEELLDEASNRALKTVWFNPAGGGAANGGESAALQAAILGLHTLAGEFPTELWETRKDYLAATISEINEILGKQ